MESAVLTRPMLIEIMRMAYLEGSVNAVNNPFTCYGKFEVFADKQIAWLESLEVLNERS